jgi:hypothetical protein
MDRCFEFDPANLCPDVTCPSLMFDHQVDALDHNAVLVSISPDLAAIAVDLVAGDHTLHRAPHLTTFAPRIRSISACNDFDRVPSFDPFHL